MDYRAVFVAKFLLPNLHFLLKAVYTDCSSAYELQKPTYEFAFSAKISTFHGLEFIIPTTRYFLYRYELIINKLSLAFRGILISFSPSILTSRDASKGI